MNHPTAQILKNRNLRTASAALFLALTQLSSSAFAAEYYWDLNGSTAGAGGSTATTPIGTWDTVTANWSTSTAGTTATAAQTTTTADNIHFSAGTTATGAYAVTVSGAQAANAIFFEEGTTTLSGSAITLGTGTLDVASGRTATIGNALTYTAINKTSAGTLALTGANTYSSPITITAGTLQFGGSAAGTYSGNIANSGVLQFSASVAQTMSGVISGTGSLSRDTNLVTLTLSGANTYTGATNISRGSVSVSSIGSSAAAGGLGQNDLSINLGGTYSAGGLTYTGTGETSARALNLTGLTGGTTLTQSGTGLLKFTSDVLVTGLGTKTIALAGSTAGSGELAGKIVDGANSTSSLTPAQVTPAAVVGTQTIGLSSTLGIQVGDVVSGAAGIVAGTKVTAINGGVITVDTLLTASINGVTAISVTRGGTPVTLLNQTALSKTGTGTWTLSGDNSFSGGTTISSGTLATGATGNFGTGNVTISAALGKLTLGNANSIADTATLSLFAGSSLFLNYNGTEQVGGLTVAGTALALNDVAASANFNTNLFSAADLIAKGYLNASGTGLLQVGASMIPEPATYATLAGLGILGFAAYRRRRAA